MKQPPLAGPVDLLLTVTEDRVRLTGPGIEVAADHGGVRSGLAEAVNETRRSRARVSLPVRGPAETQVRAGELSLGRAARLLGESFLPGPVRSELGRVLAAAERAHQPVRLGLAVPPELAGLPWEALPEPGWPRPAGAAPAGQPVPQDGRGGGPGAAGAAADRGRDRRPRHRRRAGAGL